MQPGTAFWDNIAEKYRKSAISDQTAYEYTLERVASYLHTDDQVLEIGCGTGGTAHKLASFAGHITATDFSSGMIAQAQARPKVNNVTFQTASVFDDSLHKEFYNAVLAFNLFHLVADFRDHVERIRDLLAPGGVFISKTPCLSDPSAKLKYRLMIRVIPLMQLVGKAPFCKFRPIAEMHRVIETSGFDIVETGNYPAQAPNHFIVARKV